MGDFRSAPCRDGPDLQAAATAPTSTARRVWVCGTGISSTVASTGAVDSTYRPAPVVLDWHGPGAVLSKTGLLGVAQSCSPGPVWLRGCGGRTAAAAIRGLALAGRVALAAGAGPALASSEAVTVEGFVFCKAPRGGGTTLNGVGTARLLESGSTVRRLPFWGDLVGSAGDGRYAVGTDVGQGVASPDTVAGL